MEFLFEGVPIDLPHVTVVAISALADKKGISFEDAALGLISSGMNTEAQLIGLSETGADIFIRSQKGQEVRVGAIPKKP